MRSIPMSAERIPSPSPNRPILSVAEMSVQFKLPHGWITAVDRVSFDLRQGEIVGIVGESGSGKSQILLSLMGLLASNGRCSGSA
jgi:oligopeptide transport system ATP-binding protein